MMTEESINKRNFRVSYYDKVGCRSAISTKALIAILKDDAVDCKKLENFCVRFSVPANFRPLIWQILLKVLPTHVQSHKFVIQQRSEQFDDMKRALLVMQLINDSTELSEVCLKMFLLQKGKLGLEFHSSAWHHVLTSISYVVSNIVDSPVLSYWISVYFHNFLNKNNFLKLSHEFTDVIVTTIKKENYQLFNHLEILRLFDHLPAVAWYKCAYVDVLSPAALSKIWDILLGRAPRVLPYIAVQILLSFEHNLLQLDSSSKCLSLLNQIPYSSEISEIIVSKGIENWLAAEKIP